MIFFAKRPTIVFPATLLWLGEGRGKNSEDLIGVREEDEKLKLSNMKDPMNTLVQM
jgi:hypothetical protein